MVEHQDPPGRTRVVLAEDEAIIRMDLREILAEEGYEVVGECGSGDEAIELVRLLEPDIAILDVKMPGLDGISAARRLTEERACAVVLLTAFSQRELIEEARDAGVMAYVVKPFESSDLVPAIEIALGRFAETSRLAAENEGLADKLEVRKLIDRAKGRLIDGHGMSEADAFSFLQKTAMNERRTMRDICEAVVAGELSPG
ncbi:MAG: response regulator [Microthrixaceae bacterium]|nr:response regulator [Microthrixaceae bacterium]